MLRQFKPEDAEALAVVYRDAVRTVGPVAYTKEQVESWARYPEDIEEFRARLSRGVTLIAEEDGFVVAFGQLEPDDHLAFLYCSGRFCRKGIGAEIYRALEAHAWQKGVSAISTDASRISRPFFARHGYSVVEVEHVVRSGIEFERFRMLKKPEASQSLRPTGATVRG
jgi:putative acetyltransferase